MRVYSIDQLDPGDTQKITDRFIAMGFQSIVSGLFWLPVPGECLTETQAVHKEKCGPYYLALEVEEEAVHLELLVRASGKMRCECVSFANKELRDRMIAYLEEQLTDLNVLF